MLGAAFKAGSDDVRDSPALHIAQACHDRGAAVTVYDPEAMGKAVISHPELAYATSITGAAAGADVLLVLTEWPQFAAADPAELGAVVAQRRVLDGRGVLDPDRWQAAGWQYRALGRPTLSQPGQAAAPADGPEPAAPGPPPLTTAGARVGQPT